MNMSTPLKKYAVVTDVSPSEQLTGNGENVKVMGLVFGLNSPKSFELVGSKFPDDSKSMKLRKWGGASDTYKLGAIQHASVLSESGNVIFGNNISNENTIKQVGEYVFQKIIGEFPEPSSYNKKGKPRIKLGGKVEGVEITQYEVLIDELIILGWYGESILSAHKSLMEINSDRVELDLLIDKLPLEQSDNNKARLLKQLLSKASNGLINLIGVPEKSDFEQRDLLVDNVAGLGREMERNKGSKVSKYVNEHGSPIKINRDIKH